MTASLNKAMIIGNLGTDPELRYTETNNTAVVTLSIATNESWRDKNGERQERTQWHRVIVFGRQAENCNQYLQKGRSVYVEGRIQTREWEDKDGNKRYTTEIIASKVNFLSGGDDASRQGNGSNGYQPRQGFEQDFDDADIPF